MSVPTPKIRESGLRALVICVLVVDTESNKVIRAQ